MDEFYPGTGRTASSMQPPSHALRQGYQFLKELNPSIAAHLANEVVRISDPFWRSAATTALSPEVADRVRPSSAEGIAWVTTQSGLAVPNFSAGRLIASTLAEPGHGLIATNRRDLIARVRSFPSPEARIAALLTLAPDAQAVAAAGAEAEAVRDPTERALLLAVAANGAFGDLRTRLFKRSLAVGRTMSDPAERSKLLSHLAHELEGAKGSAIWQESFRAAANIVDPAVRAKILGEIIDSLPQNLRSGTFRDIDTPLLYASSPIAISALNQSFAGQAVSDQRGYIGAALRAIKSVDSEMLRKDLLHRLTSQLIRGSVIEPDSILTAGFEYDPRKTIESLYQIPAAHWAEAGRRDLTAIIYRSADNEIRDVLVKALDENRRRRVGPLPTKAATPGTRDSSTGLTGRDERRVSLRERSGPLKEQPRHVNLWFTSQRDVDAPPLPSGINLKAGRSYWLRLSIGNQDPRSIVRAARPFPAESLPPTETGNWLEVALASHDFEVPPRRYSVFLPKAGSAWVCPCTPGTAHTCAPDHRKYYVNLGVVAPKSSGSARLRLAIYCNLNVVQSHIVRAEVSHEEEPGIGTTSYVDYTLTTGLREAGDLPARALSIIANEGNDASHLIMFNGDHDETIALHLTEAQMDMAVTEARRALYAAHVHEYGGALGAQKQLENLYDEFNSKDKEGFKADLRKLVEVGRLLWDTLFQDQRDRVRELRRTILADPSVIQIARAGRSTYVFPWALLYEIPMEPGDPEAWKYCPVIDDWNPQHDVSGKAQNTCPHEADHTAMNTICPYGFWGIRHVIEQPPSTPRLVREVVTSIPPPQAVLVTSKQLDHKLMTHHLKEIAIALSGFVMRPADSRSSMRSRLELNAIELIYFYCHGLDTIAEEAPPQPYLGIGDKGRLMPGDLGAWFEGQWTDDHWALTSPLVFINGCHTVSIIPGSLVQFVDAFVGVRAAGVVGTEITLHQRVASEAGEVFLKTLRQPGENIGSALRVMRLHLLRKGNVMGLAYTAYCSADLRFVDTS